MNKEEIEQAKGHLEWLLDNGILTSEDEPHIENILKYIQQLEQNVEASRMEHENDLKMIDEVKGNAVKWSKERDNLKVILDKVTDTIKKDRDLFNKCRKKHEMYSKSEERLNTKYHYTEKLLNIIEGEKENGK